ALIIADPAFELAGTSTAERQPPRAPRESAPSQEKVGFLSRLFGRRKATPRVYAPSAPAPTGVAAPGGRHSRDFNRSEYHFGRLPGTRVEGERIARLLGVQPWLDRAALEAELKKQHSPRILHLATHGFFLADQERDRNREARDLGLLSSPGRGG